MKKKNIFLIGLALLGMSSCNDYLDVDSPSSYTEDFVFSSVEESSTLLNGIYQALCANNIYGNAYMQTLCLNSDVEWRTNTNELQAAAHNDFYAFDGEADGAAALNAWTAAYKVIERANDFISGAEKSPILDDLSEGNSEDRATLLQQIGEAKCLRAMTYFDLTILMGDIPFSFTRSYDAENLIMPITDRDDIQDALIKDLQEAAPNMKLSTEINSIEHCTKEFAWSLIARISMFRGGYSLRHSEDPSSPGFMKRDEANYRSYYEIAKQYCDSVIEAETHSLTKEWYQVFIDECNYIASLNDDPIFEIPFTMNVSGNVGYIQGPSYSLSTTSDAVWGKCSGNVRLSAFHRFTYDNDDVRRNAIGLWQYTDNVPAELNTQTNFCNKWSKLFDNSHKMSVDADGGTGINFPYMRYADVLLMRAEAENELNGPEEAKDYLKQVRRRAFPNNTAKSDDYVDANGTTKEDFLKLIQDERSWEFAGEGLRWKDLVRWNIYNKTIFKEFWKFYAIGDQDEGPFELLGLDYNAYPKDYYWKVVSPGDPDFDTTFPNQTLDQIAFYKNEAAGFDNKWQNYGVTYQELLQEAVNWMKSGTQPKIWMNWTDDNLGIANAACRLSVRGYIYKDQRTNTQGATGIPSEFTSLADLENLPALRYILPIPQDAINRSNGTYKNYYGY